jgi:hypothetical protein
MDNPIDLIIAGFRDGEQAAEVLEELKLLKKEKIIGPWINLCKTGQPYIFCPHLISLVEVAARGFCSLEYNSSSNQTPLLQRLPSFAYFL